MPTATALAYGPHQKEKTNFLVLDLGGGTFDVSVLERFEGVMDVRATAGDNFLSRENFDAVLVAHFLATPAAAGPPDATTGAPTPRGTACTLSGWPAAEGGVCDSRVRP